MAPSVQTLERSRVRPTLAGLSGQLGWRQTFAALRYPNYRLWFVGQTVSLFGTWMQSTAQGYLIFELTHSPSYLGYVAFAAGVPAWLFMLYAGVIADRMPRRTLLIITQIGMMMLAFVLAALTFTGLVQPWHIVALAFGLGVANAFDAPARLAFVLEMVDREDLTNAIALNSAQFNMASSVGPAAGGIIYALVGPGWCFTINGVTFLAVIIALGLMRLKPLALPARRASAVADLKEGLSYVAREPLVRAIIALVGASSLFGLSFIALIPAWAVSVLGGDATTNGLLQSARGVGALIGALLIASLGAFKFKGKLLTFGSFAFAITLLIFAFMRSVPLALLTLVGVGTALILFLNVANGLVQTLVPDALRGRVMGVYAFIFFGLFPLGGLWAGTLAEHIGEPTTIILGSVACLGFASLAWVLVPRLRALE
jgi:MFS family permease